MSEQLELFDEKTFKFEINIQDVENFKDRMKKQIALKTGGINRLCKARRDDIFSFQLANENLQLKEENQKLIEVIQTRGKNI